MCDHCATKVVTLFCTKFYAMTTLRLVLRKRANQDSTRPLILQITKDRKRSIMHLGINLLESQWDKANRKVRKNHPNSTRLNNLLLKKLAVL